MSDDLNKRLCEKLGICWHEQVDGQTLQCKHCGNPMLFPWQQHPDFTTDAGKVMLLREMLKRKDWPEFYRSLKWSVFVEDYILDTTGQLRDKCIDFLNRRKG
jgi:hypothetical protein